jgi:hypothetical protein
MSGGPKYEYLWQDGTKFKKPTHLPANQYISLLMDWIEQQINDEAIFPVTMDIAFPRNFTSVCKKGRGSGAQQTDSVLLMATVKTRDTFGKIIIYFWGSVSDTRKTSLGVGT